MRRAAVRVCRAPAASVIGNQPKIYRDFGGIRGVRLQERMNSPLQDRKVRLRGLGGQAVCGVPGTCASATGTVETRKQ
jgi:hypothetical protein